MFFGKTHADTTVEAANLSWNPWNPWFVAGINKVPHCALPVLERRELLFEELLKNTILSKYRNSDDPAFKTFIRTACCDAVIADSFFRYQ